jgi:ribose 5-phosphate isomerase B
MKKEILIGSDHAGIELKTDLVLFLQSEGYTVTDMGAHTLVPDDDYPTILTPLAMKIATEPEKYIGIVLGGSGTGEAIVCNRFPGVRAALFYGTTKDDEAFDIVRLARTHNDANVLSLGARFITRSIAEKAVKIFLDTEFSNQERHSRRIKLIDSIE